MTAISKTGAVVFALVIGMPKIDHRSAKRTAAPRQHEAGKFEAKDAGFRIDRLLLRIEEQIRSAG